MAREKTRIIPTRDITAVNLAFSLKGFQIRNRAAANRQIKAMIPYLPILVGEAKPYKRTDNARLAATAPIAAKRLRQMSFKSKGPTKEKTKRRIKIAIRIKRVSDIKKILDSSRFNRAVRRKRTCLKL
jgi:hypothetical protein